MFNRNKNNREEKKDCKEDKNQNHNVSNLCKSYIHEIRNIKSLDKEMINNIRNMSNEEKIDIIISFNEVIEYIKELLE